MSINSHKSRPFIGGLFGSIISQFKLPKKIVSFEIVVAASKIALTSSFHWFFRDIRRLLGARLKARDGLDARARVHSSHEIWRTRETTRSLILFGRRG